MNTILKIKNVSKTYESAGRTLTVLDDINFYAETGSTLSIVGPSGSGKIIPVIFLKLNLYRSSFLY